MTMAKTMSEPVRDEALDTAVADELSERELETVSGGAPNTASSIMKTKHDTVKNTISNIH
jgi:bacteriocin-like protein